MKSITSSRDSRLGKLIGVPSLCALQNWQIEVLERAGAGWRINTQAQFFLILMKIAQTSCSRS
jgi:hypothetical protein